MADAVLKAKLETLLVRELALEYMHVNRTYFKAALVNPQIALVPSRAHLGRWLHDTRTLEISRPLVLEQPWGAVIEVLKHEIAHQYVHEILGETSETPHGPAFRATCARLGIDAAASGVPRANAEHSRLVEKVARLLALAESSNRHEAEAAAAQAQRLMLKHNLDVQKDARGYAFRHVGRPTGRVIESERLLAMILGKHFFVEVIWVPVYRPLEGKRGSVLEVCGTSANLEIAEYVHQFLTHTAERLWADHKRARGIPGDRDRRTYLAGVMAGFAEKLGRQAKQHAEEGLVWVKDADLAHFLRARHPHIRHVRSAGQRRNEAFTHGKRAGHGIVIHRGVTAGSESRGHLLPPRQP
jgi:predicted SprT family Zn-dependent metalloprotease